MFSDIKLESDRRIVEIREYIDFIANQMPPPPTTTPRPLNTAKGLVYVQLYGIIEHTLSQSVTRTIDCINESHTLINDIKPAILSLALDARLEALIQVNTKKWDKRHLVFSEFTNNPKVDIPDHLLPTDGKNITDKQLQSIWNTFSIDNDLFHDVTFRGRLQDIVTNRINIAHGNSTASEVGSSITIDDLRTRLDDVSTFCTYLVGVFEDYIQNNKFKKSSI
jgi:hypothetical protein